MKRVYKSKEEPELLRQYRLHNPEETWEHFRRRCRKGYKQVREAILRDQHGLCAYCEVGIKLAEEEGEVDDFAWSIFIRKMLRRSMGTTIIWIGAICWACATAAVSPMCLIPSGAIPARSVTAAAMCLRVGVKLQTISSIR